LELRPQSKGIAGTNRRGHGAHPEGVDGAAALRLAGPSFPVPHRLHLAAPVAAAASTHVRARNEPRGVRVRRPSPPGLRRLLRAVRGHGPRHALLPGAVLALRMEPDT